MSNTTQKEYKSPEGVVQVRFIREDGKVRISDSESREVTITEVQARWLATELETEFGGGPQSTLDMDRFVFFTGTVQEDKIRDCQKELLRLAFKFKEKTKEKKVKADDIGLTLYINTFGGSCAHATALIDTIEAVRGMGVPVRGIVQGTAYSAGSTILQACTTRLVARHARVMVHQVASGVMGKLDDIEESIKEAHAINRSMAEIYAERNTAGKTDPKFWVKFMAGKDKYLTGQECMTLGLADGIYRPLEEPDAR